MTKIVGYLLLVLVWTTGLAAPDLGGGYKLGSGDVITIKVFGEPDLSFDQLRVTDAGTLPYPFLGELRVGGRTPQELTQLITRGLADGYLVNPRVTVNVTTYRQFYVNGEVKSPGGYPYQSGLTVRKAIALAGGKTERASENKISVIREGDVGGEPVRVTLDSQVYPGDILTIEESFF